MRYVVVYAEYYRQIVEADNEAEAYHVFKDSDPDGEYFDSEVTSVREADEYD